MPSPTIEEQSLRDDVSEGWPSSPPTQTTDEQALGNINGDEEGSTFRINITAVNTCFQSM